MTKMYDVMIIDDISENLKTLSGLLLRNGYTTRTLLSGKLALKSAVLKKPDLVIIEINMPGMDGYEICYAFKRDMRIKDIPIIFITDYSDSESVVKIFKTGGVDYITKPFQEEEVLAKVQTQLQLIQTNHDLEDVQSKTFMGSVHILIDILSTTKPVVFQQATLMRQIVRRVAKDLELKDQWVYEIAALLSRIGYVILSDDMLDAYVEGDLSAITPLEHRDSVEYGIHLIEQIPRMEPVVDILEKWYEPHSKEFFQRTLKGWTQAEIGVNLLRLVLSYLELSNEFTNQLVVFENLELRSKLYHPELLSALIRIESGIKRETEKTISLHELRIGMIVSREVSTLDKVKLLGPESEISESLLKLIVRYQKRVGITEPIYVWEMHE